MHKNHASILLLLASWPSLAHAQDLPPKTTDDKTIRALISQLGDESFAKREAASKRLTEIGELALPLLDKVAAQTTDAEVRERALELVHEIQRRLFPFVWSMKGDKFRVTRVRLLPGGKQYLASGFQFLWLGEVATGKELKKFGLNVSHRSMDISRDGKLAFVGGDDNIARLFDLTTGNELRQFVGHQGQVWGVAILHDGKRGVSGAKDKSMRLWDLETGKQLGEFTGAMENVQCLALSPDGQTLACAHSTEGMGRTGWVRLWDVEKKTELRELKGHTGVVASVSFSADGKQLVTAGYDHTARIWDVASGKELKRFDAGNELECAVFADNGRYILCAGKPNDLTVQVWDVERGERLRRSPVMDRGMRDIAPLPDGTAVVACVNGTLTLWQWRK